ncbi:molecular chaperone DnaJ [Halobiforma lacisalsi AJ5]|uniref:Heat shock protein DnaJ domain-containing protein n=1 Tax=Natronobacterium lacisalsi AJ5 TaxID=358396 RepID=M0LFT3_NATLA|nr:DnaJ domain-containing protein [Halobiforma lacisalsi]APW99041.1 molecular chaperone DnaJ [Halobiforma lacisalsi AJ5]EMA31304.1 heat shock protein DnaJ domain-containing protein [Halobiforma lacisalsi AJ5]
MAETYYDVLEVDPDATPAEIEAAYRERVLETHPDQSDDPDAAEEFQRVAEAESVLGDEAERARYDRLGHEAYVELADGPATADSGERDGSTGDEDPSADPGRGTADGARGTNTRTRGTGRRGSTASQTGTSSGRSGRRGGRRRTGNRSRWQEVYEEVNRETAGTGTSERANPGKGFSTPEGASAAETDAGTGEAGTESAADDGYAVHDWDDDVDLEWQGRPLTRSAAVTLACLWALYPLFVYSSVTPVFATWTNAVVAACTLAFVAYALTFPRVATAMFGFWSLVIPTVVVRTAILSPFSLRGAATIAFAWIPFGYAIVVWWALRP